MLHVVVDAWKFIVEQQKFSSFNLRNGIRTKTLSDPNRLRFNEWVKNGLQMLVELQIPSIFQFIPKWIIYNHRQIRFVNIFPKNFLSQRKTFSSFSCFQLILVKNFFD